MMRIVGKGLTGPAGIGGKLHASGLGTGASRAMAYYPPYTGGGGSRFGPGSAKRYLSASVILGGLALAEGVYIYRNRVETSDRRGYALATDKATAAESLLQAWRPLKTSVKVRIGEEEVGIPVRAPKDYWKWLAFQAIGVVWVSANTEIRARLEDGEGVEPADVSGFLGELAGAGIEGVIVVEGVEGCGKTTALKLFVWNEVQKGRPALYVQWSPRAAAGIGPTQVPNLSISDLLSISDAFTTRRESLTIVIDDVSASDLPAISALTSALPTHNIRLIVATSDFSLAGAVIDTAGGPSVKVVRLDPPSPKEIQRVVQTALTDTGRDAQLLDAYCEVIGSFRCLPDKCGDIQSFTQTAFNQQIADLPKRISAAVCAADTHIRAADVRTVLDTLCKQLYYYPVSLAEVALCHALTSVGLLRPAAPDRDWYQFRDSTVQTAVRAVLGLPVNTEESDGRLQGSGKLHTLEALARGKVGFDRARTRVEQLWSEGVTGGKRRKRREKATNRRKND